MEMQVPQQDLQVVVHEPMQVVEQDMEEVHVVQQVVDEATEEFQGEEHVVKVQTTPKKVSSMLSARNLHQKNHVIARACMDL
jgi:hypothetical protein